MLNQKLIGFVFATLFILSIGVGGCALLNDGYPSVNCKINDDCFGFQEEHCSGGICMMIDAAPDSPPVPDAAPVPDASDVDADDVDASNVDAADPDATELDASDVDGSSEEAL
jgi:hypothetical protein